MDPIDRLDWLTRAYRVGRIIRTAALLGICDVLGPEPMAAEQVAARSGAPDGCAWRLVKPRR